MEAQTLTVGNVMLTTKIGDELEIRLMNRPAIAVEIPAARLERWAIKALREEILVAGKQHNDN